MRLSFIIKDYMDVLVQVNEVVATVKGMKDRKVYRVRKKLLGRWAHSLGHVDSSYWGIN
jgi:hypothetical protein